MVWQPRWRHVSQLYRHAGDALGVIEGANDCYETCLARYLRETGYPFAGDDAALVGAMRLLATGQSDHAGQGYTTLEQGSHALDALSIPWRWTGGLAEAREVPWAIYWVQAAALRTTTPNVVEGRRVYTDYPASWLSGGGAPDHFILRLPNGAFNDPLSYWNGEKDTTYTATSVAAAFGGAYLLSGAPKAARSGTGGRQAAGGASLVVACAPGLHLRQAPTLDATILATLQDGEAVQDVYAGECLWTFVRARGLRGWVKREYVRGR